MIKVEQNSAPERAHDVAKGAVRHQDKKSKRVRQRDANIDLLAHYGVDEALGLIKQRANAKFDETVEVVFACKVDPRKGDQNIRGMIELPHGTGRTVRIAVFAQDDQAQQARDAGADIVGDLALVEEVQKGRLDFDLCIATPAMMVHLSKLGKVLGPKGLMPNPKLGTVTMKVAEAVQAAKRGQVSLRAEKQGIVHAILGKVSFDLSALSGNFQAVQSALLDMKPEGVKGNLIKKAYVSSTMGFSLQLDLNKGLS
jgi:large subunit ribosomal protein L1